MLDGQGHDHTFGKRNLYQVDEPYNKICQEMRLSNIISSYIPNFEKLYLYIQYAQRLTNVGVLNEAQNRVKFLVRYFMFRQLR